jgi:peroxiredoxin
MALLHGNPVRLNTPAIDFSLKSVDGKTYSLKDFENRKILVIIFMCNHCPYVKAVTGRFVRFQAEYGAKGVQLIGINPNDTDAYPEDSYPNMKIFADEREINFPYLFDETQETATKYDAVCTPDIYVYDEKRLLRYRGRFDDNWQEEGKVTAKDLKKAVDSLLEGGKIDFAQVPSMGCSIKWKSN